jgi:hypothetical protein
MKRTYHMPLTRMDLSSYHLSIILKNGKAQHPKKDITVDTTIRNTNHGLHIIMVLAFG